VWLTLAYKTALWQRIDAKHFPKIEDVLREDAGQTPEDLLNKIKMLNAKFGGD
jgi:hypothetical protein